MKREYIESELIQRAKEQDRNAQRLLYEKYYSYGMSICCRYYQSKEKTLELLNAGFLKAFISLESFNTAMSFKAWFRKILVNAIIDTKREENASQFFEVLQAFDSQMELSASLYDDQLEIEASVDIQLLEKLISQIPEPSQTVFNMYVIDDMPHHEIAMLLKCSVRTSKRYLAQARQWLIERVPKSLKTNYHDF